MKRPVILAVDDAPDLLALMAKVLAKEYEVKTATSGAAALIAAGADPAPGLILLDVEMPGMSGFEVCKALKANPATADVPVIFLTGKGETRDEMEGFVLGAVDYVTKPIKAAVLMARVGAHVALANRRAALEGMVRKRTAQLEGAHLELIKCLSRAMEFHESAAVGNRFQRLSQYASLVSEALGARPSVCEMMAKAAPLHDLGKIALPADILRRPGKLSAPDWERVRRHCEYGAAIIGVHDDPLLKLARVVALTHHENWDGSGYPKGLKGEAIPWPGRVMAVVDAYESMTTTQFYRDALTPQAASNEITRNVGTRYDAATVEAFRKAQPAMRKVRAAIKDDLDQVINLDFSQTAVMKLAPVKPAAKR
jgi:putative two-component system response regulator